VFVIRCFLDLFVCASDKSPLFTRRDFHVLAVLFGLCVPQTPHEQVWSTQDDQSVYATWFAYAFNKSSEELGGAPKIKLDYCQDVSRVVLEFTALVQAC
jgi:hypothetical protein